MEKPATGIATRDVRAVGQKDFRILDWVLVASLTVAGLGLRLAYAVQVPPFLDEYSSILTGMSILRTGGIPRLPSGVLYPSGSLFSYLEAIFVGLLGFSDFVARLPSLLVSGLTLPILYLAARTMLDRRVALVSVALLAFMPEAVVWGGRARMYALLQLLVLLAVYFFYRSVLDRTENTGARTVPGWIWVLCFLGAVFAQDEALLLLPALWLAALVGRGAGWFLRPGVLLGQVLLPIAGAASRFWLNQIRVPGEVYVGVHYRFFRFPPALAHGLEKVAPFFTDPWAWPVTVFFLLALVFLVYGYYASGSVPETSRHSQYTTRFAQRLGRLMAPVFLAYVVLAITAAIVLVVNNPWQDDRYLFMILPCFLMVAAWGVDRLIAFLAHRWSPLRRDWVTPVLVLVVAAAMLPAGVSALSRYEPDYSAAYQWLAPRLGDEDLVASVRPAPAAVYLGRADFMLAEDKHREFIMRLDGEWVDRWAGAKVIESPEAFRTEVLGLGRRVWFVIDEKRFESVSYSPDFVALILEQMDLVWRDGGVLVFEGQGYQPPPEMTVAGTVDANFGEQLLLRGYELDTDHPEPGQDLRLRLYWQAIAPERDYTVFVHVVGADGQGLTQVDGEPLLGLYSMSTHWPRDRAVPDERWLAIPEDTPPGRYRLEVGLYDADNTDAGPLPILTPNGEVAGQRLILDYLKVNLPSPAEPSQEVPVGNLGGLVRLAGVDPRLPEQVTVGSTLPLTLTWEVLADVEADYTVFVHLAGPDGQPVAQADGQPLGGTYPTSFWDVGERLADPHLLEVPSDIPPGDYELLVGLYLVSSGDRLPLLGPDGQVLGDSISLGRLKGSLP
jgi:predicted membrane-bound mannosyltransferase